MHLENSLIAGCSSAYVAGAAPSSAAEHATATVAETAPTLCDLPNELRSRIGEYLTPGDHIRFATATGEIKRGGYPVARNEANEASASLTGLLTDPATSAADRSLAREALLASRTAAEAGVPGGRHTAASTAARPEAEAFFESLSEPEVFARLVPHARNDARLWSMLQGAWTRRTPEQARREREALAPLLSATQAADLDKIAAIDARALAETVKEEHLLHKIEGVTDNASSLEALAIVSALGKSLPKSMMNFSHYYTLRWVNDRAPVSQDDVAGVRERLRANLAACREHGDAQGVKVRGQAIKALAADSRLQVQELHNLSDTGLFLSEEGMEFDYNSDARETYHSALATVNDPYAKMHSVMRLEQAMDRLFPGYAQSLYSDALYFTALLEEIRKLAKPSLQEMYDILSRNRKP